MAFLMDTANMISRRREAFTDMESVVPSTLLYDCTG